MNLSVFLFTSLLISVCIWIWVLLTAYRQERVDDTLQILSNKEDVAPVKRKPA